MPVRPLDVSLLVHAKVRDTEALKLARPFITFEHRDRADRTGEQASVGKDAHGGQSLHGQSCLGMEHMPVSPTLNFDAQFVIPAGCQRAVIKVHRTHPFRRASRMTDRDLLGSSIRMRPDDANIPAEVDKPMCHAGNRAQFRGAVGHVDWRPAQTFANPLIAGPWDDTNWPNPATEFFQAGP